MLQPQWQVDVLDPEVRRLFWRQQQGGISGSDPNGTYLAPSSSRKRGSNVLHRPEINGFPRSRE